MSVSVNVTNNITDGALRRLRSQVAPTLSAIRDRKDYKKPGFRRREEQKKNTINSRKNSRRNNYRNSQSKMASKKYAS